MNIYFIILRFIDIIILIASPLETFIFKKSIIFKKLIDESKLRIYNNNICYEYVFNLIRR